MDSPYLDEWDRLILEELQKDGRSSNAEIARMIGASEATVRRRLASLIESGACQIVVAMNPLKLGYQLAVLLHLSVELGKVEAAARELSNYEQVNYVSLIAGEFDILVHAHFRSNDEIYYFINQKVAHIDGVKSTRTSYVLRVLKRTHLWLPLEEELPDEIATH